MNRYQKMAWFNLVVIISTIILITTVVTIEIRTRGYSKIGFWCLAPLVLLRFNRLFFRKPQGEDVVVSDERDAFIIKRALSFAYTAFWIVFFLTSFAVFVSTGMGPKSTVPAITLPLMVIGGAFFMKIVCSIAILVQYGRGGKDE